MTVHMCCLQLADQKLIIGGAIADPVDGGLLIFENSTKDEAILASFNCKCNGLMDGGVTKLPLQTAKRQSQ